MPSKSTKQNKIKESSKALRPAVQPHHPNPAIKLTSFTLLAKTRLGQSTCGRLKEYAKHSHLEARATKPAHTWPCTCPSARHGQSRPTAAGLGALTVTSTRVSAVSAVTRKMLPEKRHKSRSVPPTAASPVCQDVVTLWAVRCQPRAGGVSVRVAARVVLALFTWSQHLAPPTFPTKNSRLTWQKGRQNFHP